MNSQMTDLALAGKCGCFGASGLTASAPERIEVRRPSCSSNPASANKPKPLPTRFKNSRRVRYISGGGAKSLGMFMLFHIHKFIQAHQDLAEVGQGQLAAIRFSGGQIRIGLLFDERDAVR